MDFLILLNYFLELWEAVHCVTLPVESSTLCGHNHREKYCFQFNKLYLFIQFINLNHIEKQEIQ
jgi:hypothetical protein